MTSRFLVLSGRAQMLQWKPRFYAVLTLAALTVAAFGGYAGARRHAPAVRLVDPRRDRAGGPAATAARRAGARLHGGHTHSCGSRGLFARQDHSTGTLARARRAACGVDVRGALSGPGRRRRRGRRLAPLRLRRRDDGALRLAGRRARSRRSGRSRTCSGTARRSASPTTPRCSAARRRSPASRSSGSTRRPSAAVLGGRHRGVRRLLGQPAADHARRRRPLGAARSRCSCARTRDGTVIPFALMASASLMLVVLWQRSPVLSVALVGPLLAIALYQRSTFAR